MSTELREGVPDGWESLHAFDRHSTGYVTGWGSDPLARVLRARVLAVCAREFAVGSRVLELGCGPGIDAQVLEGLGLRVTALDASRGMVEQARRRVSNVLHLSMERLELLGEGDFDGAFSNFGALNCVAEPAVVGAGLAAVVRPGARVVLVYMGPRCLAEDIALALRGRLPRRRDGPVALEGASVRVRYLTAQAVEAAFPAFRVLRREALGLLVAPPDLGGRPGRRTRVEPALAGLPVLRDLGDHQLMVLERR